MAPFALILLDCPKRKPQKTIMKRREFLKVLGATTGACALTQTSVFSADYTNTKPAEETVAGMPRRILGRTKARVTSG